MTRGRHNPRHEREVARKSRKYHRRLFFTGVRPPVRARYPPLVPPPHEHLTDDSRCVVTAFPQQARRTFPRRLISYPAASVDGSPITRAPNDTSWDHPTRTYRHVRVSRGISWRDRRSSGRSACGDSKHPRFRMTTLDPSCQCRDWWWASKGFNPLRLQCGPGVGQALTAHGDSCGPVDNLVA